MKKKILSIFTALVMLCCTFGFCGCEWIVEELTGGHRTYVIHFDPNGGEGTMENYVVEKGYDGLLPGCKFTKEGFECMSWSTTPDGKDGYGKASSLSMALPRNIKNGDTVTLYAVWTTPGFTFSVNGIGYFQSAHIVEYAGNAKDVVIPAYTKGPYDSPSVVGWGPVHEVGDGVFEGHTEIESVSNFPENNIASSMFEGCTSLQSFQSRQAIEDIGERAFYHCQSLQALGLIDRNIISNRDSITIGKEAFYGCMSLTTLVIPWYVEAIGDNAFYGWTAEQTIRFEKYTESEFIAEFGSEWRSGCNATIVWSETN
ncbi:MAG: leucine-rich repeat domain-containing protein [Clostridia bacterium]|nr:leucine-rich repeat domain-containing protein [Clostridia bacterium]